jgi:trimethylamine--corrinoid protein Co-methyltransferase
MAIPVLRGGQLRVLDETGMRRIDAAVKRVLAEVGVRMEWRPALEAMRDAGCDVDFATNLVKVPEHVLRRALATAPSRFTLAGQEPGFDVEVDLERVYTIGGSSALFTLGLDGVRRPASLKDLVDFTRLLDTLENLHVMHAIVIPQEIPQTGFDRVLWANVVSHTRRNYYSQGNGAQSIRDQVAMASAVLGPGAALRARPIFTMVLCMVSPLLQPGIRLAEMMECVKHGIPIYIEVDAQSGGTTPVTTAGTVVEECANVLAGVTLAQVLAPGHPCVFAIASGVMDMGTGNYSGGAPETALVHAATAQMAHFYGLPFQGGTGIESTQPDAQAGYERALQVLTNALAGTNFIHLSIGMMEQMLLASYEQCLIDDEILGAAFRIVRGIEVTDEDIAFEVIRELGPANGMYLAHEHTVRNLRRVGWFPKLTNREKWDAWQAKGGKDMRERAREAAAKVLAAPAAPRLEPKLAAELLRMAAAFQKDAIVRGELDGA